MKILFDRYDYCIVRDSPETINWIETRQARYWWCKSYGWIYPIFKFVDRFIGKTKLEIGIELRGVAYVMILDWNQ